MEELDRALTRQRYETPQRASFDFRGTMLPEALAKLREIYGWEVGATDDARHEAFELVLRQATFFEALDGIRKACRLAYKIPDRAPASGRTVSLPLELCKPAEGA